jgi:hypothetical protein
MGWALAVAQSNSRVETQRHDDRGGRDDRREPVEGPKSQQRQIEAVIDLLSGPLWSELLMQARKLIVESRDSYVWGG